MLRHGSVAQGGGAESVSTSAAPPPNLPPVPLDQMLVLVNRFIKSSVETLDDFAQSSQTRLDAIADELTDLEAMLTLVESKVPPSVIAQAPSQGAPTPAAPIVVSATSLPASAIPIIANPPRYHSPDHLPPLPAVGTTATTTQPTAAHALNKYTSMLKMGVPREAVLAKMDLDKVDRSLLPSSS